MTTEQKTGVAAGTAIDQARVEQFAGDLVQKLNGAAATLMISIGNQTGLFDTMAQTGAAGSDGIARAAGLNERYVREWLGAMVTSGIVEYNAAEATYLLPPEHAASLTHAAGPGNLGVFAQFIPLMADVEQEIIHCFRNGGGVPYSAYPRFQKLMSEQSGQIFDGTLVNVTLPLVPGLPERLRQGIDVADIACGSGHAINVMAREFPASRFVGYDISQEGIAAARDQAAAMRLANARFELKDVATLDGSAQFDLITVFDAIHDQAHPARVLKGIHDSLRPGGAFLCVDVAASSNLAENLQHPLGPACYTISTMHCMTVSLASGGDGLGNMWGEQKARQMLAEAGFPEVEVKKVEGDILNNYYICRKQEFAPPHRGKGYYRV